VSILPAYVPKVTKRNKGALVPIVLALRKQWWRRRTGIEPASGALRRSLVLKTRGTTRNPDASGHDCTDSSPDRE
jgi:hypothetical protein